MYAANMDLTRSLEDLSQVAAILDSGRNVRWVNGAGKDVLGREPGPGETCFRLLFGMEAPCPVCPLPGDDGGPGAEGPTAQCPAAQSLIPLRDAAGVPSGAILILRTGPLQAAPMESASDQHASEQRYRNLVEFSPLWILETDVQGNVLYINRQAERDSGYSAEEIRGKSILEFIPPEDRADAAKALMAGLSGSHNAVRTRLLMKDGSVRVFLNNSGLIQGEGDEMRLIVFAEDVTAAVTAEQALVQQVQIEKTASTISKFLAGAEDLDKAIPAALEILAKAADANTAFVYLALEEGAKVEKMYEWTAPGAPAGSPVHARFDSDDFPAWKAALLAGKAVVVTHREELPADGGRARELMERSGEHAILILPLISRGVVLGLVGLGDTRKSRAWSESDMRMFDLVAEVFTAFMVRKRSEEAERNARRAAEVADRAKTAFLANMSHEIRTPLTGIIGMLDLASEAGLPPGQSEFLDLARSSAETLFGLLGGILDLAKIESGTFDLESGPFDLRSVVEETLAAVGLRAHEKGLEIAAVVDPALPAPLVGDARRVRQILENLADNAVKFTEAGEVVARVRLARREAQGLIVSFSVEDTGIGIEPSERGRIFESFSRAGPALKGGYGGTGLGLAISQQLVTRMGGTIEVESRPGGGSVFAFEIPLPAAPGARVLGPRRPFKGRRVLVADDHEPTREGALGLLGVLGFDTASAVDAAEAFEAVSRARDSRMPFDLVLLDADLAGDEILDLLGRLEDGGAPPEAIALLFAGAPKNRRSSRWAARKNLFRLLKPLRSAALEDVARRVLAPEERAPTGPGPGPGAGGASMRILLAEDNLVTRKLVTALLARHGWVVQCVPDGQSAVKAARARRFDAVLMDIQMPILDGIEATRFIRDEEADRGTRVPIIALTAHAMKEDRDRCLQAGMDDYIAKPLREGDLVAALERWARPSDQGPGGAGRIPPVNLEDIRERLGLDLPTVLEMLEILLEDAPSHIARLERALDASKAETLTAAAHRLKGAAGNLGAEPLFLAARDLETYGRRADLAAARERFPAVKEELERLRAFVEAQRTERREPGRPPTPAG